MTTALTDGVLLERLIGFDTTSVRSNRALTDFLADYLDAPGVTLSHQPSPDGDKANLVAATGPEDPGRDGLTLCGHTDVVPADEPGWDTDPFRATVRDDRIIGRGACDMKGFLAVAANALRAASARTLRAPLALVCTYDEELGALGARHLVEHGRAASRIPRRVIVGEPTSLRPVRAHKGHLKLTVTVEGVAAHSALPHLGRNAIEPAARAVGALAALRRALEQERDPASSLFPTVPYHSLSVATIRGGRAANIIPDSCTIGVGIRLLPGHDPSELVDRVRDTLVAALGPDGFRLTPAGMTPAFLLDHHAEVLRGVREVAGVSEDGSVDFGTDAGWLQELPCDCVIFGPGAMDVAHRPNEYLARSELAGAADAVRRLVDRWCGPEGG